MDDGAFSILANIAKVQSLFPRGFPVITEGLKAGVGKIRLRKSLLGIPAFFDPETNEIEIDPEADWKKLAAGINARYPWLGVTPEDAPVFMYLHECGHARRREHVLAMPHRNLRGIRGSAFFLMDQIVIGEEEEAADDYARERFRKWREGRP